MMMGARPRPLYFEKHPFKHNDTAMDKFGKVQHFANNLEGSI